MQWDALKVFPHITVHWNELWGAQLLLFCKVCRTKTNDLLYYEVPSLKQRTRILFNVTLQLNIKSMSH